MRRHRWVGAVLVATALLGVGTGSMAAQQNGRSQALRVFFECSGGWQGCDQRQFRTDIDWVNWMRDRADAQVHVILTSQRTGSGGDQFRLDFIGLGDLEGRDDQLSYTSLGTDVRDEVVSGVGRTLAVGLARYAVLAGAATGLAITGPSQGEEAPMDRLVGADEVDDPWDFWVFRLNLNGNMNGESTRTSARVSGGFQASRVTETWKMDFEADGSWRRSEIQLSEDTIVDTRRNWEVEGGAVYSLADHWSLGVESGVSAATSTNQDLRADVTPALEYSVWPYAEAPRRSLRARYRIGLRYFNYEETTIFGFDSETRGVQEVEVYLNQRQPWGSVFANVEGSHYLHDLDRWRLSTGGFLSFRVVRGLDLRINGRVEWIRDQLYLSASGVTDEEILLQRRRLQSNFDWDFGVGFSFQFGSIYNNVVNNRF